MQQAVDLAEPFYFIAVLIVHTLYIHMNHNGYRVHVPIDIYDHRKKCCRTNIGKWVGKSSFPTLKLPRSGTSNKIQVSEFSFPIIGIKSFNLRNIKQFQCMVFNFPDLLSRDS